MVLSYWILHLYNFVQLHLIYDNISTFFYLGYAFMIILLPLVIMVISRLLLGFILVIYKNQELIKTIKRILEVFPEGIIIQSKEKNNNELLLQFVNDTASKEIISKENISGKIIEDK